MNHGLPRNLSILNSLFHRVDLGCVVFELSPPHYHPDINITKGSLDLIELGPILQCTSVNKPLLKKLNISGFPERFTLQDWMKRFPKSRDHLTQCEKKGEVKFAYHMDDPIYKGHWIKGEYILCFDKDDKLEGLIGVFRNNTEVKQLESKVIAHQDKLELTELILEKSQLMAKIGIWKLNLENNSLVWNNTLHRLYDIPVDTQNLYEEYRSKIHPEDIGYFDKNIDKSLESGSPFTIEYRVIKNKGEVAYVVGNGNPIFSEEGKITGFFGLCQDISDLKRAQLKLEHANKGLEEKVDERTRELEVSGKRLKAVLQQLQQYTYFVSHNLRGPVANIKGLSELFDTQAEDSQENREILTRISQLSENLDGIIRDLNEILSTDNFNEDLTFNLEDRTKPIE